MSRRIRVAVLGAGSWGTTVASLASRNTQTKLWARDSATADEINREHRNTRYLQDLPLCTRLIATASLADAVRDCDVLVVGVPSHNFRDTLRAVSPLLRPWVPVISLAKGLEQGSHNRMTEIIQQELPGPSGRPVGRPEHRSRSAAGLCRSGSAGDERRQRRQGAAAAVQQRGVPRLHQPRRDRLRARRTAEERDRHFRRHGPKACRSARTRERW
jgi:ketopantoate reductase